MKKMRIILMAGLVTVLAACNAGNADNPSNSAESPESDTALEATGDMGSTAVMDSVYVDSTQANTTNMR